MPTKITTGKTRLSYAHVFNAHSNFPNQEAKFSAQFIWPKTDTVTTDAIKGAIIAETKAMFGEKAPPANWKNPLRDGDIVERPETKGCYFINASSKSAPGLIDLNKQRVINPAEIYSGCYVRAQLAFFVYDTTVNKGVGCGLNHIQKLADGPSLEGKGDPEAAFDDKPPVDPSNVVDPTSWLK